VAHELFALVDLDGGGVGQVLQALMGDFGQDLGGIDANSRFQVLHHPGARAYLMFMAVDDDRDQMLNGGIGVRCGSGFGRG
jgi:hypothetical protein